MIIMTKSLAKCAECDQCLSCWQYSHHFPLLTCSLTVSHTCSLTVEHCCSYFSMYWICKIWKNSFMNIGNIPESRIFPHWQYCTENRNIVLVTLTGLFCTVSPTDPPGDRKNYYFLITFSVSPNWAKDNTCVSLPGTCCSLTVVHSCS